MTRNEAIKKASKSNPNIPYSFNAGNGWTGSVYYCSRRNRKIFETTKNGIILH